MAAEPRLNLSRNNRMLTPADITDHKRMGRTVRAELGVLIPHGSSSRLITVRLTAKECLELAEAAIAAARLLCDLPADEPSEGAE